MYGATLGLVFIVFVGAETIRGSKRWIDIGFIQFQPSELGKVLFVLALAGFVVGRVGPTTRWRTIFSVIGLGVAPILLVFMQPDLGTALVYGAALFAVLFFVGVRWRQLVVCSRSASSRSRPSSGSFRPPACRCSSRTRPRASRSTRAPTRAGSPTT